MNSHNAFGFAVLGLVMNLVPTWFPELVTQAARGDSSRAIWLMVMGLVLIAISVTWFAHLAWLQRPRVLALFARTAEANAARRASVAAGSRARVSI